MSSPFFLNATQIFFPSSCLWCRGTGMGNLSFHHPWSPLFLLLSLFCCSVGYLSQHSPLWAWGLQNSCSHIFSPFSLAIATLEQLFPLFQTFYPRGAATGPDVLSLGQQCSCWNHCCWLQWTWVKLLAASPRSHAVSPLLPKPFQSRAQNHEAKQASICIWKCPVSIALSHLVHSAQKSRSGWGNANRWI